MAQVYLSINCFTSVGAMGEKSRRNDIDCAVPWTKYFLAGCEISRPWYRYRYNEISWLWCYERQGDSEIFSP